MNTKPHPALADWLRRISYFLGVAVILSIFAWLLMMVAAASQQPVSGSAFSSRASLAR